jgi:hypothetical protein
MGTINPVTRKQYLPDGYAPRTARHSYAVLRGFCQSWIEEGSVERCATAAFASRNFVS